MVVELKNNKTKYLTPKPMHFLELIAKECEGIFKTGDDILVYGLNVMQESGTIIYILDLKSEK